MAFVIAFVGIVAGALTTLTGAGGGVFLIISLSLLVGPHAALAASAPTLLVGNLHRLTLYRREVDRRVAFRVISGALPGSIAGGALAVSLPEGVLQGLFVALAVYAAARAMGRLAWTPPQSLLAPAGAAVGAISATSGGAGLLLAPLLLSTGLTGKAYVATSAAVALSTHIGRLGAYGVRGLLTDEVLAVAGLATIAVVLGNMTGDRLRRFVNERRAPVLEYGTLAVCSLLAVVALIRR